MLKVQLHLHEADGKPSFLRMAVPAQTKLISTPYGTLFPWGGTSGNLYPSQRRGAVFIFLIYLKTVTINSPQGKGKSTSTHPTNTLTYNHFQLNKYFPHIHKPTVAVLLHL